MAKTISALEAATLGLTVVGNRPVKNTYLTIQADPSDLQPWTLTVDKCRAIIAAYEGSQRDFWSILRIFADPSGEGAKVLRTQKNPYIAIGSYEGRPMLILRTGKDDKGMSAGRWKWDKFVAMADRIGESNLLEKIAEVADMPIGNKQARHTDKPRLATRAVTKTQARKNKAAMKQASRAETALADLEASRPGPTIAYLTEVIVALYSDPTPDNLLKAQGIAADIAALMAV